MGLEKRLREFQRCSSRRKEDLLESEYLSEVNNENDPRNINKSQRENSVISARTKEGDKSINLSRKDSFMTNVSKRYQEQASDETSSEGEDGENRKMLDNSYSQISCQEKRENMLKGSSKRDRSLSPLLLAEIQLEQTLKRKKKREK